MSWKSSSELDRDKIEPVFEAFVGGGFVVLAGVVEQDVEGAAS